MLLLKCIQFIFKISKLIMQNISYKVTVNRKLNLTCVKWILVFKRSIKLEHESSFISN